MAFPKSSYWPRHPARHQAHGRFSHGRSWRIGSGRCRKRNPATSVPGSSLKHFPVRSHHSAPLVAMVRDARRRAPHHGGLRSRPNGLRPHPEEPALAGVSKDEAIEVEVAPAQMRKPRKVAGLSFLVVRSSLVARSGSVRDGSRSTRTDGALGRVNLSAIAFAAAGFASLTRSTQCRYFSNIVSNAPSRPAKTKCSPGKGGLPFCHIRFPSPL